MTLTADTRERLKYSLTSQAARDELAAILDLFTPNAAGTVVASSALQAESASGALVAFATGGQTNATALPSQVNRIGTCATAGDSAKLPAATAGLTIIVINSGAAAADIFPQTGEAINALAANTALRIGVRTVVSFTCAVAGTWLSAPIPLAAAKYVKNVTAGATVAAAGDLTGAAYTSAEFSAVGAANLTTRTATQMFADMPNVNVGDSYILEITNTSAGTTTLVAGAGVTLTGTMTMATNSTRRFVVTFTSATALVIQSIGVGTIS